MASHGHSVAAAAPDLTPTTTKRKDMTLSLTTKILEPQLHRLNEFEYAVSIPALRASESHLNHPQLAKSSSSKKIEGVTEVC